MVKTKKIQKLVGNSLEILNNLENKRVFAYTWDLCVDRMVKELVSYDNSLTNHVYFYGGGGADGLTGFSFALEVMKKLRLNKGNWVFTCLSGCNNNTKTWIKTKATKPELEWYESYTLNSRVDNNIFCSHKTDKFIKTCCGDNEFYLLDANFYTSENQPKKLLGILEKYHNRMSKQCKMLGGIIVETGWDSMMFMDSYYTCDVQDDAFIMETINKLHKNTNGDDFFSYFVQSNCDMEPQHYFPKELKNSVIKFSSYYGISDYSVFIIDIWKEVIAKILSSKDNGNSKENTYINIIRRLIINSNGNFRCNVFLTTLMNIHFCGLYPSILLKIKKNNIDKGIESKICRKHPKTYGSKNPSYIININNIKLMFSRLNTSFDKSRYPIYHKFIKGGNINYDWNYWLGSWISYRFKNNCYKLNMISPNSGNSGVFQPKFINLTANQYVMIGIIHRLILEKRGGKSKGGKKHTVIKLSNIFRNLNNLSTNNKCSPLIFHSMLQRSAQLTTFICSISLYGWDEFNRHIRKLLIKSMIDIDKIDTKIDKCYKILSEYFKSGINIKNYYNDLKKIIHLENSKELIVNSSYINKEIPYGIIGLEKNISCYLYYYYLYISIVY